MRVLVLFLSIATIGAGAGVWLGCGGTSGDAFTIPAPDGGEGGANGSSGGPREAGANGVTADGGVDPASAAPGGDTTSIACGATSCPIPAESCCVTDLPNNGGRSYACVAGSSCPAAAGGGDTTALKCSSAANCAAGTVCCVMQTNGVTTSACQATCVSGKGTDTAQLCDPKAPDGGGCPAGAPCSNDSIGDWGLPKTFATCGGKGN